jgi:hypothetical protein
MTTFADVIADAKRDLEVLAARHCKRLKAKLLAAGMPRDRASYEVAQFRQVIEADIARRIAALRRECMEVVK